MSKIEKPIRGSEVIRMRAKELRKQATPAEKILWEELRDRRLNGIKFRRQHVLGAYIVDFYRSEFKLAIEIDGDMHHYQAEDDLIRTNNLIDLGIRVVQFWKYEVEQDIDSVLVRIAECCDLPSPIYGRRAGDEGTP